MPLWRLPEFPQQLRKPMSEEKKRRKKGKKDSQLVIRISSEERDRFVALCDDLDTSAAREIRRFIRDFMALHHKKGV